MTQHDLLILGGGLVGASLAYSLRNTPLNIALIESTPWEFNQSPHKQVIALNYTSKCIFEGLGIWQSLSSQATPITQIHISNQGQFGYAHLTAAALNLPALGYVISAQAIDLALKQALSNTKVTIYAPAKLQKLRVDSAKVQLSLQLPWQELNLEGQLLVVATGGGSPVLSQLGIQPVQQDYGQVAVITTLQTERSHQGTAYERFTPQGPLALLPLGQRACSVVWCVTDSRKQHLLGLSESAFLGELQAAFGWRLGRLHSVGQRLAYPLYLRYTANLIRDRTVVIGNAAHTLHPVAGQGFNLGLRDVATLAELIYTASFEEDVSAIATSEQLKKYLNLQQPDQRHLIRLTDGLIRIFSNSNQPLTFLRNLGLLALDQLPPLKFQLMRYLSGFTGYPSRLACGLPLKKDV